MKFCATRYQNDVGFGEIFEAADWQAANRHCRERGWFLDGELKLEIPLSPLGWFRKAKRWITTALSAGKEQKP